MKQILIGILLMGFSTASWAIEDPVVKKIDLTNSTLFWKGQKVTGAHEGTIEFTSGELHYEEGKLVDAVFLVNMTTIANTDLGERGRGRLEGHLKSADFFNVEEHPGATLDFTKVVSRGTEGSYKVVADLTIKGITNSVKFNIVTENGMMKTDLVIDRSEYNVKYGSGSFFDNLGDKTIYDEFELNAVIALQQEQ